MYNLLVFIVLKLPVFRIAFYIFQMLSFINGYESLFLFLILQNATKEK